MRNYQLTKNNPYWLPHSVYMQALWAIRDYYRLIEEADSIITESGKQDGQPKGSGVGDPVYQKMLKRDQIMAKANAVKSAMEVIPEEYRSGVWKSILYGERYPFDADRRTYGRWKARYVYQVAENIGLI